jgi:hypothetical protein
LEPSIKNRFELTVENTLIFGVNLQSRIMKL